MPDRLKPGERAPSSGQYHVYGPRGKDLNREITAVKGKPLPGGGVDGSVRYELIDETKHKDK